MARNKKKATGHSKKGGYGFSKTHREPVPGGFRMPNDNMRGKAKRGKSRS